MEDITNPEIFYRQRINNLADNLIFLNDRKKWLGWLRLLIVVAGAAGIYFSWSNILWQSLTIIFITVTIFLIILNLDLTNREAI
ncbi:MAG: hypothetical protein ACRC2O_14110, partial [Chitinophagaceae bacterium]